MAYGKKVMELFQHPKNIGDLANANGVGQVGNPVCGDVMKVFIKVKGNVIDEVKVKTFGCVAAIASSSMLTELVKGKTLEEALKVSKQDVVDALGGLPDEKIHCSVLAVDGLKKAIEDFKAKHKN
jgi:nitrogen fixation NifU-like protein